MVEKSDTNLLKVYRNHVRPFVSHRLPIPRQASDGVMPAYFSSLYTFATWSPIFSQLYLLMS